MPKATVRANARSLSKAKPRPGTVFNLVQARANWEAAASEYGAASERYLTMCREMDAAALAAAAERSKRLKAVYDEEDRLAVVIDRRDNTASKILAAPASIEALRLKLDLFSHQWAKERAVDQPLDGGDVADVAAAIVLDLLTLLRRGSLAEIAKAA
jgi:hypothetical protein